MFLSRLLVGLIIIDRHVFCIGKKIPRGRICFFDIVDPRPAGQCHSRGFYTFITCSFKKMGDRHHPEEISIDAAGHFMLLSFYYVQCPATRLEHILLSDFFKILKSVLFLTPGISWEGLYRPGYFPFHDRIVLFQPGTIPDFGFINICRKTKLSISRYGI
jgi:hypothetical protein